MEIVSELVENEWATVIRNSEAVATKEKMPSIMASRTKLEYYNAEFARLRYQKEEGVLVNAQEVRDEAFKCARNVRDAMLNIPDRIANELAFETNPFKVHARITEEIKKALAGLSDE